MSRIRNRHTVPAVSRLARLASCSLVVLAASSAAPAVAAKVYRCGNAFQDQPCQEVKLAVATLPADRGVVVIRDNSCASAPRDGTGRPDCAAKTPLAREDAKR